MSSELEDDYSPIDSELLHLAALLSLDNSSYDTRRFICGFRTGLYQSVLAVEEGEAETVQIHKKTVIDAKKKDNDALQWGIVAGRVLGLMANGITLEDKWISKISSQSYKTTMEDTGKKPRKTQPKRSSKKESKKNSSPTS